MSKSLQHFLMIAFLAAMIVVFRVQLRNEFLFLMNAYLPCRLPIAYSIGTFDTRFGLTQAEFLQAVHDAERIWEKPIGKELFNQEQNGSVRINLIYDNRQDVTVQLQALGLTLSDSHASYDALRTKYVTLNTHYEQERSQYESLVMAFNAHQDAYNAEVAKANARGGAKPAEYTRLNAQRQSLETEIQNIQVVERTINADADTINALVTELNREARALNLHVGQYNKVGATRGEEFDEGLYQSGPNGTEIDIYQYDDRAKLVRVLAHELGHALGLEHVDDPNAIMYRLNQGANEKLTTTDLAALKTLCGIER